ncbi:hypothetical protein [Acidovorax sp. MR-S7]|uniref:hypothetical protein n=1 Tax=Acidovorax sp. MR-S7 TaxID=1268622 RepID=UPI0003D3E400|nr:hypothetical protein [Acidovorax sp. MR-S7]GAD20903.1 hypothetical protein AVS7_00664 [Acidovorax sp. MR-S7]
MTEPTDWPHMLPCPFCGGDARHDAHADDCYFILHRKFKNSGADMSPAFEVLAAWNRRAPQPTQAQAGAVPLTCEWTHNADDSFWDTECGQSWRFDDGGPKENHMNFCHCCGKTLRIKGGQHGAE